MAKVAERVVAIFVTDGTESTPLSEVVRSLAVGGIQAVYAGVPGITEVFLQGNTLPLPMRSMTEFNPENTRGLVIPESPTLAHELLREPVRRVIAQFITEDLPVVTWGGGVVAAMNAGLLQGRRVAGAYESIPSLLKGGVEVVEDRVVEDLPWITARSFLDVGEALRLGFGFGAHGNRIGEYRRTTKEPR